jgi:hypothetical protein
MMVLDSVAATSFPSCFFSLSHMPPPLRHPILGIRHGSRRLLPIFVRHQPRHRHAQWLLHVHENVSQHVCIIIFVIGRPVRLPGLRHVLPLQPTASAHDRSREPTDARRHVYGASRSCSWPFFVRFTEEDTVAPATLRLCWRWGVQIWDIGQPRPVARQQSTYATKLVVVLCRLGGSRARKALAFSRPSQTDAWCGSLSVWSCSGWASFSACVPSPYMYLAIYYLYRLQMPRYSSCPSPAMNMHVRLFLPFLLYETLELGEARDGGPWFATYGTRSMARQRLSIWPFLYHGVDSVCFYHFYVPVTHPSVIAKIIVLFLCFLGVSFLLC